MGLFGRDDFIDDNNGNKEPIVNTKMTNDEVFDTITINFIDIRGGSLTLGEIKKDYDSIKYIPLSAAKGLLIFSSETNKTLNCRVCVCNSKFAHQLRPLWKNADFFFYIEDEYDECDLGD